MVLRQVDVPFSDRGVREWKLRHFSSGRDQMLVTKATEKFGDETRRGRKEEKNGREENGIGGGGGGAEKRKDKEEMQRGGMRRRGESIDMRGTTTTLNNTKCVMLM